MQGGIMKVLHLIPSFLAACLIGGLLHYALQRIFLPVEPFLNMTF
jgi:hypothetical protein